MLAILVDVSNRVKSHTKIKEKEPRGRSWCPIKTPRKTRTQPNRADYLKVGGRVRKLRGKKVVSRAPLAARAGPSASPRASCEASAGPKPAQTAPMGPYQQARHLLRLLERVLKVLGWLTTPDWQVGQHQLQVRGKRVKCPIEFKETLLKPG